VAPSNGTLRDMVCRGLLLMLERADQISLPPVSYVRHNPLAHRARPEPVPIDTTPIEDRLRNLQPLVFEQVRRTGREPLFNSLMEEHHYLGYEQPSSRRRERKSGPTKWPVRHPSDEVSRTGPEMASIHPALCLRPGAASLRSTRIPARSIPASARKATG
jgi:hypothetical protein